MRRTITVYVEPNARLIDTIRAFNEATNEILRVGFKEKTHNKIKLHHLTYYAIREKYHLPASLTTAARDCASEMLKREKCKKLPVKKLFGGIRYNARTFSFNKRESIASLSSVSGRVKIRVHIPTCFRRYMAWDIKSASLSFDGSRLAIRMVAETNSPRKVMIHNGNVLGVDSGIYNHAVLSNNLFYDSKHIRAVKARYQYNRSVLQAKGTRSARRKLKKLSGREKRFMANVNHRISKWIVNQPFDVIALESLGTIKQDSKGGPTLNRMLGNWAFRELQRFAGYKAEALGKTVVHVNPRFTSQKCSNCGSTSKDARNKHRFRCSRCGFELHADLNAARNISKIGKADLGRLLVNEPIVASSANEFDLVASQLQTQRSLPR